MRKVLLAGLCVSLLAFRVPSIRGGDFECGMVTGWTTCGLAAFIATTAFNDSGFDLNVFLRNTTVVSAGVFGAVLTSMGVAHFFVKPWLALKEVRNFLEGTSGNNNEIILQTIKKAGSDVKKAAELVLSYSSGYNSYYCRHEILRAASKLSSLHSFLNDKEQQLRSFLSSFWLQSTVKKAQGYICEIVQIREFVEAVIADIKGRDLYKAQIAQKEADERQAFEDGIREREALARRKIVVYDGQPPVPPVPNTTTN